MMTPQAWSCFAKQQYVCVCVPARALSGEGSNPAVPEALEKHENQV